MKYSDNFNRDFNWYLSVRHSFNFDGKTPIEITFNAKGIDGKKAFYIYDSKGKLNETKHPHLLSTLIRTKGSVNLHIKMYAEGMADGTFPKIEFNEFCEKIKSPEWFINAVEQQKIKIHKR